MSWVASLTLGAKGNRDPFVTQHLGAPPPTDPPFSLGQGHSSPLPVKVLRLSSLSNCNSSLLEFHQPLSLNLECPSHPTLSLSLVCLSFKNNPREAIIGKSEQRLGGTTIQMFYANPTTAPTRPHIDRCSRPTKPIRFASSPPDCLFTEGTCPSLGIPDKNRDFPTLSLLICFLDQLPLPLPILIESEWHFIDSYSKVRHSVLQLIRHWQRDRSFHQDDAHTVWQISSSPTSPQWHTHSEVDTVTQTVTHSVTEAVLIHPPHQYLCDPSSLHIHQEMLRFQINQNQENPKTFLQTNTHWSSRIPKRCH